MTENEQLDIPPKVQAELEAAERLVTSGEDELVNSLIGPHDKAHALLDSATDELHSAIDSLVGQLDIKLTDGEAQLFKALDAAFRKADDTLSQGENELRQAGWEYPYSPGDVKSVLDIGVTNALPMMVPQLSTREFTTGDTTNGGTKPPITPVDDGPKPPITPVDEPTTPPVTPPPPPIPPVQPTPTDCLSPMGLPWCDSPEGIALTDSLYQQGYTLGQAYDEVSGCQFSYINYPNGPRLGERVCAGSCYAADGTSFGYGSPGQCGPTDSPPTSPPWPVPPPPPTGEPPTSPPTSPPWPCPPPAAPCCPDPVITVNVTVPPIIIPPYPAPPPSTPPVTPSPPPYFPPTDEPTPTPTTPPVTPLPPRPPPPPPPPTFTNRPLPEVNDIPYIFDWRYSDACERIESMLSETPGIKPPVLSVSAAEQGTVDSLLSWFAESISGVANDAVESAVENATPYVVSAGIDAVIASGFKLVNVVFGAAGLTFNQHADRLLKLGTSLAMSAWAERLTGAPIQYLNQDTLYAYRYESPQFIPSQGELDDLYRKSLINRDTYLCLTRAQGNIPTWRETLAYGAQARPSAGELHRLYDRKWIDSEEWSRRMALHGYKDNADQDLSYQASEQFLDIRTSFEAYFRDAISLETLGEYATGAGWRRKDQIEAFAQTMYFIPPYSDVIRMMVHDVEDATVVADYKLDTSFGDKFKGTLEKWARQQRIPYEAALYMWRSHWNYPSPTQTYQFLHRLRPDRPERVEWEKDNPRGPAESEYEYRNRGPLAFTVEDAKRLLAVNDMAPTFIGPEIAISYNPITRTDAIRAYEIGVFDEQRLGWSFIENGYNDADAALLVGFEKEQKSRRLANATGVLTIRKVIKYFKQGAINRGKASDLLVPLMTNPVDRQNILDRAEDEMTSESRALRIISLKRQFMTGAISIQGATQTLLDYGVDRFAADTITEQWAYQLKSRLKEPTAMMLCKWRNHQFITDAEYFERLQRLGYSYDDASRILSVCVSDMLAKQRAAAEKANEKAKKELEKALKNQYELEKASQKQLEKWLDNLRKNMEKAQKQLDKLKKEQGENAPPA